MLPEVDDEISIARDEWESTVSRSEAMNSEELDYVIERVESGKFEGLQVFIKKCQDAHFEQWRKAIKQENEENSAAARREFEMDRWNYA